MQNLDKTMIDKLINRFPVCRTIEARQPDQHSFLDVLEGA